MQKKTYKIIIPVLIAVFIALNINVFVHKKFIKTYTFTEIENRGYTTQDIKEINIKHSYINRILSYDEWIISIEFEKMPEILFLFTYKNDQIIFQGVEGKEYIQQLDKEEIFEYSEKFKNGTLLKNL